MENAYTSQTDTDPLPSAPTDGCRFSLQCSRELSMTLHRLATSLRECPRELTSADCDAVEQDFHIFLLELAVWFHDYRAGHFPHRAPMRFADMERVCDLLSGDGQTFGLLAPVCSSVHGFLKTFSDYALRSDWMEERGLWSGDECCRLVERVVRVMTDYVQLLHRRDHLLFHLRADGLDRRKALLGMQACTRAYRPLITRLHHYRTELSHLCTVEEIDALYARLCSVGNSSDAALCEWWDKGQMAKWRFFVRLCMANHFLTEADEETRHGDSSVMYSIGENMQSNFCLLLFDYRDSLRFSLKTDGLSTSGDKREIDDNRLLKLISGTISPEISSSVFSRAKRGYVHDHRRAHLTVPASSLSLSPVSSSSSDEEPVAGPHPLLSPYLRPLVPMCGTSTPLLRVA